MTDEPRLTAARPDLAAAHLEGKVEAARFVEGEEYSVTVPVLDILSEPAQTAGMTSQLLLGEIFTVYEKTDAFAWGQAARDGYVGYVATTALAPAGSAPTAQIGALLTHVYATPQLKTRPVETLPFQARVTPVGTDGDFTELDSGGFVPSPHVTSSDAQATDPVEVAERFLGTPYLWGGRSSFGIDCSGLVQATFQACGVSVLRDSDMQEGIGRDRPVDGSLQRGDLIFWRGHVGFMLDAETLLHANAHAMAVTHEPLAEVIARIHKAEGLSVRAVRRP